MRVFDVANIDELPTLPFVLHNLRQKVHSSNSGCAEVLRIIMRDPAMSALILKTVNNSFAGHPKLINSVPKAISLLGFERVVKIALSAPIFPITKANSKIQGFDLIEFWKHSIACAIAAETISEVLNIGFEEELFIGGLLHDFGKIAIVHKERKLIEHIMRLTEDNGVTFHQAETILAIKCHSEIGWELAQSWNFPDSLQNVIKFHHSPFESQRHQKQVMIIYLADFIARSFCQGNSGDNSIDRILAGVLIELDIQMTTLKKIYKKLLNKINKR